MKCLPIYLADHNNSHIYTEAYVPSKIISKFITPDDLKTKLIIMKEYIDAGKDIRYFYDDLNIKEVLLWKDLYRLIKADELGIIKIKTNEDELNNLKFKKQIFYKFNLTNRKSLSLLSDDLDATKVESGIFIQDNTTSDIYLIYINKKPGIMAKIKNVFNKNVLIGILKKLTRCEN